MQEILKTIIIFGIVLMASYAWFNFESLLSQVRPQIGLIEEAITSTYIFPISLDKAPTATLQISNPIQ